MSDSVIIIEHLSKRYVIRHQRSRADGFRHVLEAAVRAPLKWLRSRDEEKKAQSEELWALNDVSLEVKQGEAIAIIGRNGAGKDTLLKILSRITEPTRGRIYLKGRLASLLEVGTGFHAELTGRENIFLNGAILGMKRIEIKNRFDEIVAFAGVEKFLDTPVKRYSSGMYVRLAFAVAAHLESEILIVDEVLAVGDLDFQKKCLGKMENVASGGRTVLFVSHNMAVIKSLCKRTILLSAGQVQSVGPTDEVLDQYYRQHLNHSGTDLVDRIDRTGSGNVRVVNFEARSCDNEGSTLRPGFSSEFIVGYSARSGQPISRLYVGITVTDPQGIPLFSLRYSDERLEFSRGAA